MKVKELHYDHIIRNWLSDIGESENTKKSYLLGTQHYTEFIKKTPLELIQEAEAEIRTGLLMRERKITTYLREFRESLEKGNALHSQKQNECCI